MGKGFEAVLAIATAITGVAIVAVLVGKNSKTGEVVTSIGNAYAAALREAVSPVRG